MQTNEKGWKKVCLDFCKDETLLLQKDRKKKEYWKHLPGEDKDSIPSAL